MRDLRPAAALAALLSLGLAGCSTLSSLNPFAEKASNRVLASEGERISVVQFDQSLRVSDTLRGQDFYLPEPAALAAWPLPGGNAAQSIEHVAAGGQFQIAWRRGVGQGSSRRAFVTAPPVAADGKVFAMDGRAQVTALDLASGGQAWRTDLNPEDRRDGEAFGGGLAYADGKLFVTSGYRLVAALDARDGKVLWRTRTESPIHGAPNLSGGRVFAVSTDNVLQSFDAATGAAGWSYEGLVEPARLLVSSSPAVNGETVVANFGSGEIVALRASNGGVIWSQGLSRSTRTSALSEIRDIAGRPVIYRGDIFAASHSGVFAALEERTGQPRWSLQVVSQTSPWAAGDVVYLVSKAGEVLCVSRDSGQIYWLKDLNAGKKRKQRAVFSGPVLASNRLIVVSDDGEAVALNPKTGEETGRLKLGGGAILSPIAAGGQVLVLTQDAELVAIR